MTTPDGSTTPGRPALVVMRSRGRVGVVAVGLTLIAGLVVVALSSGGARPEDKVARRVREYQELYPAAPVPQLSPDNRSLERLLNFGDAGTTWALFGEPDFHESYALFCVSKEMKRCGPPEKFTLRVVGSDGDYSIYFVQGADPRPVSREYLAVARSMSWSVLSDDPDLD